jgi:hypothetical protein
MFHISNIDELKAAGAGRPATSEAVALYRQAFERFGTQALWSRTPREHPTIAQVIAVAQSLRREGNMQSRPLAAQMEEACRSAPLRKSNRIFC